MDTSPEYIKMCNCPEIQNGRHPSVGSLFWEPKMAVFGLLVMSHEKQQYGWEKPWHEPLLMSLKDYRLLTLDHHAIWLPTQSQLQEMVGQWTIVELFGLFGQWHRSNWRKMEYRPHFPNAFITGEQLWLAFVMKEKFNKVWTGTEWKGDNDGREESQRQDGIEETAAGQIYTITSGGSKASAGDGAGGRRITV